MAAIYDKALKRKDFSGVVNKEEKENKDKPTTDDNRKRKRVYPRPSGPLLLCKSPFLECRRAQGVSVRFHTFLILVNLHFDAISFLSHLLS